MTLCNDIDAVDHPIPVFKTNIPVVRLDATDMLVDSSDVIDSHKAQRLAAIFRSQGTGPGSTSS